MLGQSKANSWSASPATDRDFSSQVTRWPAAVTTSTANAPSTGSAAKLVALTVTVAVVCGGIQSGVSRSISTGQGMVIACASPAMVNTWPPGSVISSVAAGNVTTVPGGLSMTIEYSKKPASSGPTVPIHEIPFASMLPPPLSITVTLSGSGCVTATGTAVSNGLLTQMKPV